MTEEVKTETRWVYKEVGGSSNSSPKMVGNLCKNAASRRLSVFDPHIS